jgi:hypothetical protein
MKANVGSRATGRTRAVVAEFVRRHPGSSPKQIAIGAGPSRDVARKTALRMAADGELTVAGRSHYFWVAPHRRHLAVVPDVAPHVLGDTTPDETAAPDVPAAVPAEWRCAHCADRVGTGIPLRPACGWPRARAQ